MDMVTDLAMMAVGADLAIQQAVLVMEALDLVQDLAGLR